jgi:hypothetical protein
MERPSFQGHPLMKDGRYMDDRFISLEYATEEELLEFANAVRKAGGADPLNALLPSFRKDRRDCLIATALNFGCSVDAEVLYGMENPTWPSGACKWHMRLHGPFDLQREKVEQIAASTDAEVFVVDYDNDDESKQYYLILPEHIGNAAYAFDQREGWTANYAIC